MYKRQVHIGGITLWLRGSVKDVFFEWLREHRPDLVERYERLYARGAYLPADERRTIERAAGAPWAGRTYAQRFRHRGGARVGPRGGVGGTGPRGGVAGAGLRPERDREEVVPSRQESLF